MVALFVCLRSAALSPETARTSPTCQAFLETNGVQQADGSRTDPPLAKFEEQIQKYK
jgi:hypothetical protein